MSLEQKIIKLESAHADEIKKLSQMWTKKENDFNKLEKELKNKVAALEHQVNSKVNTISDVLNHQTPKSQKNQLSRRCEECERLLKIIKEMEKQIDWYKASITRKGSNHKTENYFENSDLKSFEKEPDESHLESESIDDGIYKEIKFTISPNDKNKNVNRKVSFISDQDRVQVASKLSYNPPVVSHIKNISHNMIPQKYLRYCYC